MPGLGLGLFLNHQRGLLLFQTGRVALLHEHLEAIPVRRDLRFQPLHRLRVMLRRVRDAREADFEFRRTQPGCIEIGVDGPVVRLKRVHLRLKILQRLAHLDLAMLHAQLDLFPHLLLRGLHVGRRLDLQLVRAGEEFLRLRPRVLLPCKLQRGFLLRLLHGFDAPVQLIHHAFGIPLAPGRRGQRGIAGIGGLRHVFKFCDLRLQPLDLLMFRIELLAHFLTLLVRATGEIGADGDCRAAFRDLVHGVLHIPAELLHFRGRFLVSLGERLALLFQVHNLPLVVAAEHRDTALHVRRQIGELEVRLCSGRGIRDRRWRRCWRGRFLCDAQRGLRRLRSLGRGSQSRTCGLFFRRKLRRTVHRLFRAGAREPRSPLRSATPWEDTPCRRGRRLGCGGRGFHAGFFHPQLLGERRECRRTSLGCGTFPGIPEEPLDFLPGEADFHIVRLDHLGTENLRRPAVDLGEIHHGLALRDPP